MKRNFLDQLKANSVSSQEITERENRRLSALRNRIISEQSQMLFNDLKKDMKRKVSRGQFKKQSNGKSLVTGECIITEVGKYSTVGYPGTENDGNGVRFYHIGSDFPMAVIEKTSVKKGGGFLHSSYETKAKYKLTINSIVNEIYAQVVELCKNEGLTCEFRIEVHFKFRKSVFKDNICYFSEDWDDKFSVAYVKILSTAIY